MRLSLILAVALLAAPLAEAQETVVDTCGQSVAGLAVLAADLDCSAHDGDAIILENGQLDLRGFTLTAGNADGVSCQSTCLVFSSTTTGIVEGAAVNGISTSGSGLEVANVELHGNATGVRCDTGQLVIDNTIVTANGTGLASNDCKTKLVNVEVTLNTGHGILGLFLDITDSDVSGNGGSGIEALASLCGELNGRCPKRLRITNTTITGNNDEGIAATAGVKLFGSDVSGNGAGILVPGSWTKESGDAPDKVYFSKDLIRDSTINGNAGDGILSGSYSVKLVDSEASMNEASGIVVSPSAPKRGRARLVRSTANGNGFDGVIAVNAEGITLGIKASELTGNGTDGGICGVVTTCADVASSEEPTIKATSCGTSYDTTSGVPGSSWALCTLD